jgi:hypothetical protein
MGISALRLLIYMATNLYQNTYKPLTPAQMAMTPGGTVKLNMPQQQNQSNPVKPKKIGVKKMSPKMVQPMKKSKKKSKKMPSFEKVQKSVRETMGYSK